LIPSGGIGDAPAMSAGARRAGWRLRALWLPWLLLLAGPAQARAQTEGTAGAAEPARPVAIAVDAIAGETSALATLLQQIGPKLAAPASQKSIARLLPETKREVARQKRRLDAQLSRGFDRDDLDRQDSSWRSLDALMAGWEKTLAERLAALNALRKNLASRSAVWEETGRGARAESAPAEVRERVRSARERLAATTRTLRIRRNEALALQNDIVALHGRVTQAQQRLAAAREEFLAQLLRRSAVSLWELRGHELEASRESFRRALDESLGSLARYAQLRAGLLWLHAALVALLLWVSLRAQKAAKTVAAGAAPERRVPAGLVHPLAAGLVLGLSAGIWIHDSAPPELGQLLSLALLPSWILVLRGLLPRTLHGTVYGLAGLVLLDLARRLLGEFPELSRALLLLESSAVFAGLLWLRRPARLAAVPRPESRIWLSVLGLWMRMALAATAAATLGAVLGWVALAEILSHTVVGSAFLGTILLTAARVAEDIAQASVHAGQLDRVRLVRRNHSGFLRVVRRLVRALAFVTWLLSLLRSLGLDAAALEGSTALLSSRLGYGNLQVSLGGLLAFGVAIWVSWLIARLSQSVLESEVFTRVTLPRGVPFALATLTRYTILVLGFVLAVAALGIDVSNLTLVVSALGVGIGFGMQSMVNNFISGLILLFERPIQVGDKVQIEQLLGRVTRIGIRASIMRTFDGADVIVPNGELISGQVTNWTFKDARRRIIVPVPVALATPANEVLRILSQVAEAHPDILAEPAPSALFTGFGDSSLDFELRAWSESGEALTTVRSDLCVAIQDALDSAGIVIPFPQRDLHLKTVSGDVRGQLPQRGQRDASRPPDDE